VAVEPEDLALGLEDPLGGGDGDVGDREDRGVIWLATNRR
jgi:hypothetical protein